MLKLARKISDLQHTEHTQQAGASVLVQRLCRMKKMCMAHFFSLDSTFKWKPRARCIVQVQLKIIVHNTYTVNILVPRGGGRKICNRGDCKEETLKTFVRITSKNSASEEYFPMLFFMTHSDGQKWIRITHTHTADSDTQPKVLVRVFTTDAQDEGMRCGTQYSFFLVNAMPVLDVFYSLMKIYLRTHCK